MNIMPIPTPSSNHKRIQMINIHESTKFINELSVIRHHKVKTETKSVFIEQDFTLIKYELKITSS
jgi:hypothetical protein